MRHRSPGQAFNHRFFIYVLGGLFSGHHFPTLPPLFRHTFSLLTSFFCLPLAYLPVPLVADFQLVSITLNLTCLSLSVQRISASQLSPRLQYFGQSLSGRQDLTLDGLVDLAVGAQGQVLLLR